MNRSNSFNPTDYVDITVELTTVLQGLSLCSADATARTVLVVGVSGGMDSMVLLHALARLADPCRLTLHVAHVDHGLRPDAAADATLVQETGAMLGLPVHVTKLDPANLLRDADGVEAAARRARYQALFQVATNVTPPPQVPTVAVAHHAQDQAETVLLHLVRGAGVQGLGGMRADTLWTGAESTDVAPDECDKDTPPHPAAVRLVRPLLTFSRTALAAYARAHHVVWREDSTNTDPARTRNAIRHTILPALAALNPQIVAALNRTAEVVAADAQRLAALDRRTLNVLLVEPRQLDDLAPGLPSHGQPLDRIVLNLRMFGTFDRGAQRGALRAALARLAPGRYDDVEFAQTERLLQNLSEETTGPHPIGHGLAWSVMGEWRNRRLPYLSLHRAYVLPFGPLQPLLPPGWQPRPVSADGTVDAADGWQLSSETVPGTARPETWHAASPWACWLDAAKVGSLALTVPRAGMTIAPSGMGGHTKSLGALFRDAKIHPTLRAQWPIVVDQRTARVLWVCGLRTAADAAVDAATQTIYHLRWERREPAGKE